MLVPLENLLLKLEPEDLCIFQDNCTPNTIINSFVNYRICETQLTNDAVRLRGCMLSWLFLQWRMLRENVSFNYRWIMVKGKLR
jgi:hypothetical protein